MVILLYRHGARFQFGFDALPGQRVRAFPVDMDGGKSRRYLLNLSNETGMDLSMSASSGTGAWKAGTPLRIEGVGFNAELDPRLVCLAEAGEQRGETGGSFGENGEQT
jgi:hypothetical protein